MTLLKKVTVIFPRGETAQKAKEELLEIKREISWTGRMRFLRGIILYFPGSNSHGESSWKAIEAERRFLESNGGL